MKKSFTLIELIVVIAIVAVLAAIIAPNAFRAIEKAKISTAIGDFKTYKTAFYAYYADTGTWPVVGIAPIVGGEPRTWVYMTDNGFITNIKSLPGWDGPYLEKIKSTHPWKGIYGLDCVARFGGRDSGPACEIGLFFEDSCYYQGNPDKTCDVPESAMLKIDQTVDDGNLSKRSGGDVWRYESGDRTNLYWVIIWDAGCTDTSVM